MSLATNIGWSGRRRRYIIGAVALAVGLALAAGLVLGGAPLGARFLVFLPFAVGALGLLQAQGHT
jgi:Na+(H+)/acetate symporter ActP